MAKLEARLEPAPPLLDLEQLMPWLGWTTDDELDELEGIARSATRGDWNSTSSGRSTRRA